MQFLTKYKIVIANGLLSLFAGSITLFAFAPYNFYIVAVISLALLVVSIVNLSCHRAAWCVALFGFGMFGSNFSWAFLLHQQLFGQGLIVALTIELIIFMYIYKYLCPKPTGINLTLGFAIIWTLGEWLRSWLFSGCPSLLFGYSQLNSPLAGLLPIVGVYGTSFAVALSAGLLVNSYQHCKIAIGCNGTKSTLKNSSGVRRHHVMLALVYVVLLGLLWSVAYGLSMIHWSQSRGNPIRVSLVQGNTSTTPVKNLQGVEHRLAIYRHLSLADINSDIVVWPETALPAIPRALSLYMHEFMTHFSSHTALVTGLLVPFNPNNITSNLHYNALQVYGNGFGQYYKRHLVPFFEHFPFLLDTVSLGVSSKHVMGTFVSGPEKQALINVIGIPTASTICYDIFYETSFLHDFPKAKLIISINNDASFGHTIQAWQQLQAAQVRSLETARYQLVDGNVGLTAIISPTGKVLAQLPAWHRAVLHGVIYHTVGNTPLAYMGNLPIILGFWLLGIILLIRRRLQK